MKVNKAKKRAKGTKSSATVRQDFSPAYDLVYKVALEKFDQPSETPNPAWLSLFKREWPNALKECDLSDSHGATAKYSTFLSHVLNVYSVAPAPDAVEPNSDYDNGSSDDDDTAASDANSDDEETVPEPPSASKVHRPSSLLAVDASVRALRDVVQELVTSQTKLQQEVLRARHQAECDQLRKGLRDANTKIEALLAALRARGPTALGATVSLTAPPCPEDAANPPSTPPRPSPTLWSTHPCYQHHPSSRPPRPAALCSPPNLRVE